jgi:Protein of unknown function (DUF1800)
MASNSLYRNTAFDLSKPEFVKPQTRVEANRWLDKVTFGAATAVTDIEASTKTNIVPQAGSVDEAVELMASTYADWLDQAFTQPPMYSPTDGVTTYGKTHYLYGNETFGTASQFLYGTTSGYHRWFYNEALYGARARAKATYALSQIIVCRQASATPQQMTSFIADLFNSTLSTNTNSYKALLKRVTYNDAMGLWLTYRGNAKANAATNTRPDENYAREIMQLFSIGLDCLNMDGTPVLDGEGNVVRTYDEAYVAEAAKFFTGLKNHQIYGFPTHMVNDGTLHEVGEKRGLLYPDGSQAVLPAQTAFMSAIDTFANPNGYAVTVIDANNFSVTADEPLMVAWAANNVTVGFQKTQGGPVLVGRAQARPANATTFTITFNGHGLSTGNIIFSKSPVEASVDFFIDQLVNHPTCPVFMASRLIKLLVTNNPTPQYIRRVAEKFVDNGNGVRGDLSAVFKAIFLDRECIIPYGKNTENHGKAMTLFDRTMKLASGLRNDIIHRVGYLSDSLSDRDDRWGSPTRAVSASSQVVNMVFSKPRIKKECGGIVPDRTYFYPQPFNSPSVFNFYRPGYVPPKTKFADNGITAPELQITTAETQTIWTSIALAATHYGELRPDYSENWAPTGTSTGAGTDPRGGTFKTSGLNFAVDTAKIEVISATQGSGVVNIVGRVTLEALGNATGNSGGWTVRCYNRRLGGYCTLITSGTQRPKAAGTHDITFQTSGTQVIFDRRGVPPSADEGETQSVATSLSQHDVNNWVVGDILDTQNLFVYGHSGFPGFGVQMGHQPFITLLHKLALALPDTATVTDAELDNCINYIQDILATQEISAELRTLMKQAANVPITLPPRFTEANPLHDNLYSLMIYGYAQIRARRMLAVFIVSPEFTTQY